MIKKRKNTPIRDRNVYKNAEGHKILNPQIRSTEMHPNNKQISCRTSTGRSNDSHRRIYERNLKGD